MISFLQKTVLVMSAGWKRLANIPDKSKKIRVGKPMQINPNEYLIPIGKPNFVSALLIYN